MRLNFAAGKIEVVESCLGYGPTSGRSPLHGGHLEVLDDRVFCAVRQRKHLPYRFGRIACMAFELLVRQVSVCVSSRSLWDVLRVQGVQVFLRIFVARLLALATSGASRYYTPRASKWDEEGPASRTPRQACLEAACNDPKRSRRPDSCQPTSLLDAMSIELSPLSYPGLGQIKSTYRHTYFALATFQQVLERARNYMTYRRCAFLHGTQAEATCPFVFL